MYIEKSTQVYNLKVQSEISEVRPRPEQGITMHPILLLHVLWEWFRLSVMTTISQSDVQSGEHATKLSNFRLQLPNRCRRLRPTLAAEFWLRAARGAWAGMRGRTSCAAGSAASG